jgi:hypothetical protein
MTITVDGTNGITFPDSTLLASASVSGRLIRAPQILTTGTSYTTPANCNRILLQMIGGGGGGGGVPGTSSGSSVGGGGGPSIFAQKFITVNPSTAYTYAIGAGGTAGGGAGNGGAGGTTSITIGGVTYSCSGGGGGLTGGSGTTGSVGAAGTATNMDSFITPVSATSFYGGSVITPLGVNVGGGINSYFSQLTTGYTAYSFGAGGGGGYNGNYQGAGNLGGGAGYQGVIYIWEYT